MPQFQSPLRIAFIASYPPRRCGIGTYTKDLATGINSLNPDQLVEIIAMDNDISESLEYPWEVSHRIRQGEWQDYERVLEYLNNSVIDIVCLQHEFGIFGGRDGELIIDFIQKLKKPFVVTFHSVLVEPNENQKRIMQVISEKASMIAVMLESSQETLSRVYDVPKEKIQAIHHGAPDVPYIGNEESKQHFGLEGRLVMSSINLLGRGRGIEYAIKALPEVVKQYPEFLYLIVGQTHPVVMQHEGEVYRNELEQLVKDLKLENNVRFVNEYVSLDDLIVYVRASDLYVTPYENMETASSGSLAYAIAAGKLCISTPFRYAQEMLAGGRGLLVQARDSESIAQAILHALAYPEETDRVRQKCYQQGRKMTWTYVGLQYLEQMRLIHSRQLRPRNYPIPTLRYLTHMTDEYGLMEHSKINQKNPHEGYATDDNARALIVATRFENRKLADKYLEFLEKAEVEGKMHCDMSATGQWIDEPGLGDWFGRAFWALCYTMRFGLTASHRKRATALVRKLFASAGQIASFRSYSFILLGLSHLKELEWDEFREEQHQLFEQAVQFVQQEFAKQSTPEWQWIDDRLTYGNPRIAQALLEASQAFGRDDLKELGTTLLNFVLDQTFDIQQNHFRFVGNKGWLIRGGEKALFDEQPIEAGATVAACYAAYEATGLTYYRDMALKAFDWFHGANIKRRPLYDPKREAVYDAVTPNGVNLNQGAESILEYLLAYVCYAKLKSEEDTHDLTYPLTSK